jgi:acetylornithine/N-succinyldiaminopimelate aminotransferase
MTERGLKVAGTITTLTTQASYVRRARAADVDAMVSVIDTYVGRQRLLPRTRQEILESIAGWWVADLDGEVVGCAALRDFGDGIGELRSLSVAEAAHGRGLGELLVRHVVRAALRARIDRLYVITRIPDYFARHGFVEIPMEAVPDVLGAERVPWPRISGEGHAMELLLSVQRPNTQPATGSAAREARVHLQTYPRQPITLVRGHGSWVIDEEGREYLDLVAGIAVGVLGHAHAAVAAAVAHQARTLLQVSNLYYTLPQIELAEMLVARSPFDRAFFTNSGTETNEAAIKLARRHGRQRGAHEIVALDGSFHGRTFASLAATGQPKYREPFEPLPAGFRHVPVNDVAALEAAITERTCAVLLEPILGESGVHPLTDSFLAAARRRCDETGALLILDEVQTGMGRTGTFFAFEQTPVVPDAVTLAKGLGGGLPIGALLVREAAAAFQLGDHGTTLGGNPLSCTAALATLQVIETEDLMENARARGDQLAAGLGALVDAGAAREVRGRGLMIGLETARPNAKRVVAVARDRHGLLVNATGETTLRFVPPLTISAAEIDEALTRLRGAFHDPEARA